jgi:hypothetical protein
MWENKVSKDKFFDIKTKGAFYLMEEIKNLGLAIRRFVWIITDAIYDLFIAKHSYKETKHRQDQFH